MRRSLGVLVVVCLGLGFEALPAQEAHRLVVGALRTRGAEPGGIWVLQQQEGGWHRELVLGTQGLRNNPASLAPDPADRELFYCGTYGRDENGQVGPCHIQRLRIVGGHLTERAQLNAEPLDEDYLVAVLPLGDHVYYLGRRSLGRVLRHGGDGETLITHLPWVDARGMATDGRYLFVIASAQDIVRLDLRDNTTVTLLAQKPASQQQEELRNLAVDREGHVMAVTVTPGQVQTSNLYRFHAKTGKVLNTVQLPLAGARAVVQDPVTGDVFVSGGVSDQESAIVRVVGWQVLEHLLAAVPQALPALVMAAAGPFFTHGTGCPDKGGRVPRTAAVRREGTGARADLLGPANQPVVLLVGRHVDQRDDRLPVDLQVLGAPGCALDLTHFVAVPGQSNAAGFASISFQMAPGKVGLPYWMRIQWVAMAPGANQAQLVVSPSATVVLPVQ